MPDGLPSFLDAGEPLPFEQLFVPLVLNACEELRRQVDAAAYELLTPEGFAGWERYLLTRLTTASAHAAHWQFEIFKTARATFSTQRFAKNDRADNLYRGFVGDHPPDRLHQIFSAFPILADLCATLVRNWLSTVTEFVLRLASDHSGFRSTFPAVGVEGRVIKVDAGLSDPHRSGRCVARIHFENGARLFYKPRPLACETHFSALVDELNATAIPHTLRAARCWDKNSYGWMEEILQAPSSTRGHIDAFYWRAGVFLGLIHLAHGIDFHRENLVAAGEFPVLVDLETLWHPRMPGEDHPEVPPGSVMRTGFLPQNNLRLARYEWGALSRQTEAHRNATTWAHVNRNEMRLTTVQRATPNYPHLPALEGVTYLASEFIPHVQAGFRWAGERLLETDDHREEFSRWLLGLVRCPRRMIYRITRRYQYALGQLVQPECLQGQQERSVPLGGAFSGGPSVIESERQSLEQMDIPYFLQETSEPEFTVDALATLPTMEIYLSQLPVIADALAQNGQVVQQPS